MNLKEKCHLLRAQGKSYNFISHETGVAKSTLSFWFAKQGASQALTDKQRMLQKEASKARLLAYHAARKMSLRQAEFNALLIAQQDFQKYKKHPLFMAGLMLYAEGGNKTDRHLIRFSTSDPLVAKVFVRFMSTYFTSLQHKAMKLGLLGYSDHHIPTIEGYWLKMTGFEQNNLYKTQLLKGRLKTKRLPYGLGNVSIANRLAKIRILEFLRLGIKTLGQ